jgi:two-component system CheB/CheR fusion protein
MAYSSPESTDQAVQAVPAAGATERPWIIAIGASAGGLEALQRFFGAVKSPTNAAFVVIQHLSPDHRSMMPELLARHTVLPVQEALAGEGLAPDRVYLMPPGVLMTIEHEHLVFAPRPQHGVSLPIDAFLHSLAASLAERSIGVILSGSGSDGSSGAAALRVAGGYVMAQTPESARFDSMPRSVIAAAMVDAVLPPEDLARQVALLSSGQAGRMPTGELIGATSTKPALQRLFETLIEQSGIDFSQYKLPTVMRRIERRMAVLDCASVSDYADQVAESQDECELLRRELLIPVTGFFRDPAAFAALGEVIQSHLRNQPAHQPLRIWCAGCATGEEAYSLAILALEACHAQQRWPGVKVFATDVDARFLAIGGAGSYPAGAADPIAPERLAQFFNRQDERLLVKPELRQMVLFARHNLLEDAPFTKMDLVVCRNTLIYFQADAQERVMRRLQYALTAGGTLFLGGSESLGALQPDFQVLDGANKIYRLTRPVLTALAVRDGFGRSTLSLRGRGAARSLPVAQLPSSVEAGQRELVQAYVPLSLLVTGQRQLLHAWGPTERYLRLPQGQPNLDVLRLLPQRLGAVAGHALHCALRDRGEHPQPPIVLEIDGATVQVRVVARAMAAEGSEAACVLLSFEEAPVTDPARQAPVFDESQLDRISALERELAETRLTLQTSIEELEATNEELQAANEELMSSNEELQSTNEELQSVNEELYTVNAEYNAKLDLVSALNADLDGMSQATGIATLFVDATLALVRFTPEAMLLFRLRTDDVGRAISDFNSRLDYPSLADDLRSTLSGVPVVEREVPGPGQTRYLARVIGYGSVAAGTRRAVLSLIDISRLHDAERLQRLIDSLPEHVALLDRNGTIRQVNRPWTDFAERNGGDASRTGVGSNYLGALAHSDAPGAGELLLGVQQVLAGTRQTLCQTYPCHAPDEERWFVLHVSRLAGETDDRERGAVVTHLEVTPWMQGRTVAIEDVQEDPHA